MVLKLLPGSGNAAPLSDEERTYRKMQLKTGIAPKSTVREHRLAWVMTDADPHVPNARFYRFKFGYMETDAIVTIRAVFEDEQSGADMVITNMTTLPREMCANGFGTKALQMLLDMAKAKGLKNIQAVQVQSQSEHFWVKNGFYRLGNPTNDFRLGQK